MVTKPDRSTWLGWVSSAKVLLDHLGGFDDRSKSPDLMYGSHSGVLIPLVKIVATRKQFGLVLLFLLVKRHLVIKIK